MEFWQRDATFDRLQEILQKEPFLQTPPVQQMTLHLYSAGRKPLGRDKEYWKIEILSTDLQFRRDVIHDGHLSVTALYSEQRYYWWDCSMHNMSSFHSDMQEQITQHEKFTEVLMELHDSLSATIQKALTAGRQQVHFVISCNEGWQQCCYGPHHARGPW